MENGVEHPMKMNVEFVEGWVLLMSVDVMTSHKEIVIALVHLVYIHAVMML